MINNDCRTAKIGCVECKRKLAPRVLEFLVPIHEKRSYYLNHKDKIKEIIDHGNKRARAIAQKNLLKAREAMGI